VTEQLETGGGKWSAFVLAAVAAGHISLRGGGLAIGARRTWRVRKCAMFTRVMVHPGVGGRGEVAGEFGAEKVLLGQPGRAPTPVLG